MKKQKKIKRYGAGRVALFFLIGIVVGAILLCAAFYALENYADVDWRTYVEEQLIPQALAIIAAVGTACLALKPVIDRVALTVNSVISKFKSATDDVNATVTSSAKSEAATYEMMQQFANLREEITEIRELARQMPELIETVNAISRGVDDNTEISRVGFGSMIELTKSGASKRIMRIGARKTEDVTNDTEEA